MRDCSRCEACRSGASRENLYELAFRDWSGGLHPRAVTELSAPSSSAGVLSKSFSAI